MFNRNSALALIASTTTEQCADMATLFAKLAEAPRGPEFKAMVRRKLADVPEFDRAGYMDACRFDHARRETQMRERGWLPKQMRTKLEELGYQPDPETIEVPGVEAFLAWEEAHDARPINAGEDSAADSERQVWEIIGQASQAECRELAALFGSLAGVERDTAFSEMIRGLIDAQPSQKSLPEKRMEEGARRVIEGCHMPLWRTGWHPIQMVHELARLGWRGDDGAAPPTPGEMWAFR